MRGPWRQRDRRLRARHPGETYRLAEQFREDCEWRLERQAMRGERLDCTRDNRPLQPRD